MRNRKRLKINATTDWVEKEVEIPARAIIKRVRADAQAPGTQVALSFREISEPDSILDIPLEYTLSDSPLDSEEDIYIEVRRAQSKSANGTLFLAAKADVDCIIDIIFEFEV